jgi:hypothetical protein
MNSTSTRKKHNDGLVKSDLPKSEICDMYRKGSTLREIAAFANVSFQRVHAILLECNVPLRPRYVKKG